MLLNSCIFKRLSQRVAQPNAVHVGDEVLRSNLGDSPFLYVRVSGVCSRSTDFDLGYWAVSYIMHASP